MLIQIMRVVWKQGVQHMVLVFSLVISYFTGNQNFIIQLCCLVVKQNIFGLSECVKQVLSMCNSLKSFVEISSHIVVITLLLLVLLIPMVCLNVLNISILDIIFSWNMLEMVQLLSSIFLDLRILLIF
jgi:hypothetical protein